MHALTDPSRPSCPLGWSPADERGAGAMSRIQVKPSPEGVPGAVLASDVAGIIAEDLTYAGHGGNRVNGHLARPADERHHAAMIVIHEAGGMGEHIRDVVARFAKLGYVTLGVDLYTREGGPPPTDDLQAMMARLFSMPDDRALGDLEGAADFLRARPEVNGRVGCIGFCMGGRYTLLFAAASQRLDAAVDCWGGFIDRATLQERSTEPRPTPSPELGEQLRERAETSGQEVIVEVYEDAGHAFFADYRPSYRPSAAARLWERVVPFLASHLQTR
jgi:carboxymethylenebutenolidase